MAHGGLLSFCPYLLDTTTRLLIRDGVEVEIRKRHPVRLTLFTSRCGDVIPKDPRPAWHDVAVPPNSLDQARAIGELTKASVVSSIESASIRTQSQGRG